jgi:hypothetical protein
LRAAESAALHAPARYFEEDPNMLHSKFVFGPLLAGLLLVSGCFLDADDDDSGGSCTTDCDHTHGTCTADCDKDDNSCVVACDGDRDSCVKDCD